MTVHLRVDLAQLPGYVSGPLPPDPILLCANESALPPPPEVIAAVAGAAGRINRYPDPAATALRARLAEHVGVPVQQLAVGCGSVALCQQLVQACCVPGAGDEVMFAWRSFEAYPIVTSIAGAVPVAVPLDTNWTHDLPAMLAAITPRTRVIFVCDPNNPTSTTVGRQSLAAFLAAVPPTVLVVLDEAYHDYAATPVNGIALRERYPNVSVLRTFSKAYGLAGIRVGYLVADKQVIEAVDKVRIPFALSSVAQAAAIAALSVAPEVARTAATLGVERDRVATALAALGRPVPTPHANFVWLPLGDRTTSFDQHCLANGIVTRCYPGDGARITIGLPEENDRLLKAAESVT
ncbi:MAG: histidinol-phosphate transaminase [Actinophytocola sp.]|uniref:histidinol-phosphate transaminase n=1 Tax=Actinophytocola sp. TaxID=1872138 RepID=UPI003C75C76E